MLAEAQALGDVELGRRGPNALGRFLLGKRQFSTTNGKENTIKGLTLVILSHPRWNLGPNSPPPSDGSSNTTEAAFFDAKSGNFDPKVELDVDVDAAATGSGSATPISRGLWTSTSEAVDLRRRRDERDEVGSSAGSSESFVRSTEEVEAVERLLERRGRGGGGRRGFEAASASRRSRMVTWRSVGAESSRRL